MRIIHDYRADPHDLDEWLLWLCGVVASPVVHPFLAPSCALSPAQVQRSDSAYTPSANHTTIVVGAPVLGAYSEKQRAHSAR